jgi:TetR/AcrR family transcriptional regulator, mexJK operon transcriptional repressor
MISLHYHSRYAAASAASPIVSPLLETGQFRRGPGGRPSREEAERRHRELLATARRLLLEKGWDATSIDEISRQSGVAKRFIYARYPDKAALFVGAIKRYRTERMGALPMPDLLPADVEQGLIALGQHILDIALEPESLAIFRLFIAEAVRFRDQVRLWLEEGANDPLQSVSHILKIYADRGALKLDDPRSAAEQFFVLVVGVPQRVALLLGREPPEREERRLRAAVRLFLDGCRPRGDRAEDEASKR